MNYIKISWCYFQPAKEYELVSCQTFDLVLLSNLILSESLTFSLSKKSSLVQTRSRLAHEIAVFSEETACLPYVQRRLEVWLDHVVAQRAARAACTGMSIISA